MAERRDLRDLLRDTDFEQRRIIDDLSSYRDDQSDKDIAKDIKRGGVADFFKNLFVGLFLIAIVIGSFWVSFLVGKRVLVPPIKNIPTIEFPKPKPISSFDIKKAKIIKPVKNILAPVKKVVQPVKTETKVPMASTVATTTPTTTMTNVAVVKYYKVVEGTYANLSDAQGVAAKLKAKGIDYFVKKVSSGYRVQLGAFKTKSQAQWLVSNLKTKGFSSTVLYE